MIVETEYVTSGNMFFYRTTTTASQISQAFISGETVIVHFPYNQAASSFIANEGYINMVDYEPAYTHDYDEYEEVFGFIYPYSNLKDENNATNIFATTYVQPSVYVDHNDKLCFSPASTGGE